MIINSARFKALWPWLMEAKYAWLALGVIAIALLSSILWPSEKVIRYAGLILQLLGIVTVIWGISLTRALFGHPSFAAKVLSWLERFPLRKRTVILGAGAGAVAMISGKARAYQSHTPAENATIEQRLDSLERNIQLIHERITGTEKEMDEEFRKTAEVIKSEAHTREAEDRILHKKLEATGIGGVHISAIGALWLFVGVVLSTAALEISNLLK
jgi:hypothetical protein